MSGFEVVGLLLALPQATRDLIKLGKELYTHIEHLRNPDSLLRDLTAFDLDRDNNKLLQAADICVGIHKDARYSDFEKTCLLEDFNSMGITVAKANDSVKELLSRNWIGKALHEYRVRKKLAELTGLVMVRRNQFMDTLQLVYFKVSMLKVSRLDPHKAFSVKQEMHRQLAKHIGLFQGQLKEKIGNVEPQRGLFLIELRDYTQGTKEDREEDAKNLAETLSVAHESEAILDCVGYADLPDLSSFGIVFALPPGWGSFEPLSNYIRASPGAEPSLMVRVQLCQALAEAVLQIHTLQPPMLHKNISPSNAMLLFQSTETPTSLTTAYPLFMINWKLSRKATELTNWRSVKGWWNLIYQHPDKQVDVEEPEYTLNHDIYSLGVSMIEILLWSPLVLISEDGKPRADGLLFEEGPELLPKHIDQLGSWKGPKSSGVATVLNRLAAKRVSGIVGDESAKIVLRCLAGIENADTTIGPAFTSEIKDPLDRIKI